MATIIKTEILSSSRHIAHKFNHDAWHNVHFPKYCSATLKKNYVSKHRSFVNQKRTMVSKARIRKENWRTNDHLPFSSQ